MRMRDVSGGLGEAGRAGGVRAMVSDASRRASFAQFPRGALAVGEALNDFQARLTSVVGNEMRHSPAESAGEEAQLAPAALRTNPSASQPGEENLGVRARQPFFLGHRHRLIVAG